MSDFVNGFWSVYVALIVLVSVVGCGVFLWVQSKAKVAASPTGEVQTVGHVWDETLEEYNNPLPRWWSWMFYITVIFALGYLVMFPGLGAYQGQLNWSSRGEYESEMTTAEQKYGPIFAKFQGQDLKALAADPEAHKMGERLFLTYCSQCHGSDARGAKGFPDLTNDDWQWGGEPDQIETTIMDGRQTAMPSHAHLGDEAIKDLANYVRSLSSLQHDAERAARGKEAFTTAGCVACHGPDAKGMFAVGAPNLTDGIWLYGSSEATIIETITHGRTNKMPSHKDFLGQNKVHLLAAYVYSLSHSGAGGQ
ncbi:MAG: cytochrome-c oxidase, cbb3-type subunit III [Zoogloeaceae bacterium]|jgi:cytochrome c oxidase cbb3-type subunit 3|nr:cytochrome-c oxidase, cbb3-type subunit III [Zoogloeaceae bacterium]